MSVQEIEILHTLKAYKFQYILCVGSSLYHQPVVHQENRFNTSYVSVQANASSILLLLLFGFNTSYVSVQEYNNINNDT